MSNNQLGSDGKASKNSEKIRNKNSERKRNARKQLFYQSNSNIPTSIKNGNDASTNRVIEDD